MATGVFFVVVVVVVFFLLLLLLLLLFFCFVYHHLLNKAEGGKIPHSIFKNYAHLNIKT